MRPKSHTLFHFTKSADALRSILLGGFWPRYRLEDVEWATYAGIDFMAFPMVCFCDIPLSRIEEHVDFYGKFGIGLTKDWALRNSLNPVLYVRGKSTVSKALIELQKPSVLLRDDARRDFVLSLRHLHSYLKPVEGRVVVGGASKAKEFYLESEWRHIPQNPEIRDFLRPADLDDSTVLNRENSKVRELCALRFQPSDAKYIFVPTDADVPDMVNYIETNLGKLPAADQRLLMSRVISLDTIRADV